MAREEFEDLREENPSEDVPETKRPKHDRHAAVAYGRAQTPEARPTDDDEMIQEYEDDLKSELEALHRKTQNAIKQLRKSRKE
ncbi:hypothetical protein KL933_004572 [Ogataea haglerorum]|uniref:Uncharacterized protein n=1 Tax=Ogataea haglerorum TaxID=1937702 RepID=A0AAN6HYZ9_9ASCO|nr:hypothetical protein KL915_003953 [Ogataea haglerorum]KAG7703336.1 hypothetical protein KL914_004721 [Ogataea haglerorum]KAG7703816.1 hypothetical protein KL950_004613 [Ogataea haglerorum]KAG7714339.1 hypothetical protein KL913_004536 [Ogataea haglerorum]KAG7715108.1 hypothetical protein KL949_004501 [Ogataea haglerorum]